MTVVYGHPRSDSMNFTVAKVRLQVLACPADPMFGVSGSTNYAGNLGNGASDFQANGAFARIGDSMVATSSFIDGMSHTSLLSEWLLGPQNLRDRNPNRSVFGIDGNQGTFYEFNTFVSVCRGLDLWTSRLSRGKGSDWMSGNLSYTYYNHIMNIGEYSCVEKGAVQRGAYTPYSMHGQGSYVAFGDGHVQFIKERINLVTWRAMGSRNGSEIISEDAY